VKILIDEDEVLSRVLKAALDGDGAFYQGPKLQRAAQTGELQAYFTGLDGELQLVLDVGEDHPE